MDRDRERPPLVMSARSPGWGMTGSGQEGVVAPRIYDMCHEKQTLMYIFYSNRKITNSQMLHMYLRAYHPLLKRECFSLLALLV